MISPARLPDREALSMTLGAEQVEAAVEVMTELVSRHGGLRNLIQVVGDTVQGFHSKASAE